MSEESREKKYIIVVKLFSSLAHTSLQLLCPSFFPCQWAKTHIHLFNFFVQVSFHVSGRKRTKYSSWWSLSVDWLISMPDTCEFRHPILASINKSDQKKWKWCKIKQKYFAQTNPDANHIIFMKKILQDLLMILLCPVQGPWGSSLLFLMITLSWFCPFVCPVVTLSW